MRENTAPAEQFTGLILLTGVDTPGVAASLFVTLAPFAVHVIDVEQVVINNRLILTVLIGANPAHQKAIEADLNACALTQDVDIATLFGNSEVPAMAPGLFDVLISATKLHPRALALTTQSITNAGGNIEAFIRTSDHPISIAISISGASKNVIELALSSLLFADDTTVSVSVR